MARCDHYIKFVRAGRRALPPAEIERLFLEMAARSAPGRTDSLSNAADNCVGAMARGHDCRATWCPSRCRSSRARPTSGRTTDGVGSAARFGQSFSVASDGAGNLFVGDMANRTIRKVEIATSAVTTLAGSPGICRSTDGTEPPLDSSDSGYERTQRKTHETSWAAPTARSAGQA